MTGARNAGITPILMTGVIEKIWPDIIPERRKYADSEIRSIIELVEKGEDI